MSDRARERHLADQLRALGSDIAWPEPNAELAIGVSSEIARRAIRPRKLDTRRTVLLIAAALLSVLAVAAAARFVIGAIEVQVVPPPAVLPEDSLRLGERVSLSEAQQMGPFPIARPEILGTPDAVFVDGDRLALAWAPAERLPEIAGTGWGAVLLQLPSDHLIATKEVGAENLRKVEVAGVDGVWLTGEHVLTIAGSPSVRVDGNVLLWERDGVTLRLETRLPLDAALALGESI